jgi:intracellular septation protein
MNHAWRLLANSLSEFLPIATFVLASEIWSFMTGLKLLIVVSLICVLFSWYVERRLPKFGLFASGTILFFGSLSLIFHNPFFIIIKDTLYNLFFGLVLLVGSVKGKTILKTFFNDFFAMSDKGWMKLSNRWMYFFFLLALGNELARNFFTDDQWVLYKFAALMVTWVFGFYQFTIARDERLPEANEWGLRV